MTSKKPRCTASCAGDDQDGLRSGNPIRVWILIGLASFLFPAAADAALPAIDWQQEAAADARAEAQASKMRGKAIISFSALALGVGGVVVGALFGKAALDTRYQLDGTKPDQLALRRSLIAEGERNRLFANLGWGTAIGFGPLGGLVWVF